MEKGKPDLNRAIKEKEWNRVIELINAGTDVNVKDVPGMTPLHLAAREIKADVVELLLEKRANANALTSKGRKPGSYCPLACLVDIGTHDSRWDQIATTAKLLFHCMDKNTFAERTSTGKTLWHLLASHGNERLLALLLDWFDMKFGHGDLKAQLNALTSDDGKTGRSVLDDAMFHRSCCKLVKKKGGVNVHWRYRE